MVTELVKLIFEQAKDETPNKTKTGLSRHISKRIEENDSSKIFSYKTFTRYYDKYIMGKDGIIEHPQTEIIEELCKYIGYKNYQDFVYNNKPKKKSNQVFTMQKNINFNNENRLFKRSRKLVAKKGMNFFVSTNVLIPVIIFVAVLMSHFNNYWNKGEDFFSIKEYYEEVDHQQFINEKDVLEITKNTIADSSSFIINDKIHVLAYGKNE